MVNILRASKNPKNLFKFSLALLVLVVTVILLNSSTYNIIKKHFVKNSDKYLEMYAYTKSKPNKTEKYFIIQGNKSAESFFGKEVKAVEENNLGSINCSNAEIVLVYERPSDTIKKFVNKRQGEEIILNRGTNIEFQAAKIKNTSQSCKVGG